MKLTRAIESREYGRLGIGSILGDVLDRFDYSSTNPLSPQKMALYATHDTTIGAFLSVLGCYDGRWPAFTSNITFEMFHDPTPAGMLGYFRTHERYFIRTRYNHKVVTLPGTSSPPSHPWSASGFRIGA